MTFEYLLAEPLNEYAGDLAVQKNLAARTLSVFCAVAVLVCFMVGPYLFSHIESELIILPAFGGCLMFTLAIVLMIRKLYQTAMQLIFATLCTGILYFTILFGPSSNPVAFTIFLAFAAFFWLDHRKILFAFVKSSILLTFTAAIIIQNWSAPMPFVLELSSSQQQTVQNLSSYLVIILSGLLVYGYYKVRYSYDQSLKKSVSDEKKYLSFTAHEIRNSVLVVNTILQGFVKDKGNHVTISKSHFEALQIAFTDVRTMVKDVLSTESSGPSDVVIDTFNLRKFIYDCLVFRFLLQKKIVQIKIEYNFPVDYILTDATKMRVIVKNLVINAVKFCNHEVFIKVSGDQKTLFIEVIDDGPGILPDAEEKIFEDKFTSQQQLDSNGYGLHLVRLMCDKLSGSVAVNFNTDKGAHFYISLPVTIPDQIPNTNEPDLDCLLKPGAKVYLVDDDAVQMVAIKSLLLQFDFQVSIFSTVDEVLCAIDRSLPDLVICDLNMPIKNGRTLLKEINNHHSLKNVPVIIRSSDNIGSVQEEIFRLGAAAYLPKLADKNEMIDVINRAISRQSVRV